MNEVNEAKKKERKKHPILDDPSRGWVSWQSFIEEADKPLSFYENRENDTLQPNNFLKNE